MCGAVGRDAKGQPTSPIGAALDLVAKQQVAPENPK
jgi:hypothetical protein